MTSWPTHILDVLVGDAQRCAHALGSRTQRRRLRAGRGLIIGEAAFGRVVAILIGEVGRHVVRNVVQQLQLVLAVAF